MIDPGCGAVFFWRVQRGSEKRVRRHCKLLIIVYVREGKVEMLDKKLGLQTPPPPFGCGKVNLNS